jgi:hypothetical protein
VCEANEGDGIDISLCEAHLKGAYLITSGLIMPSVSPHARR